MTKKGNRNRKNGQQSRVDEDCPMQDQEYRTQVKKVPNRKVGFKPSQTSKNKNWSKRGNNVLMKSNFADDDIVMSCAYFQNLKISYRDRYDPPNPQGSAKNARILNASKADNRPTIFFSREASWYKVEISVKLEGVACSKQEVINAVQSVIMVPVTPILFKAVDQEASFYIDSNDIARKLYQNKQMKLHKGTLSVKVKAEIPPTIAITEELKEKLKLAMAKRYRADTKALDLSKFYVDPDLVDTYFCGLFRSNIMNTVLDIVGEHIQDLEALNLDNNKLMSVEKLKIFSKKFPKLKILYIGDNRIKDLNHLMLIRDLKLEEIRVAGNPFCKKYSGKMDIYKRVLQKFFPKLIRLDGQELRPAIKFDVVDDAVELPTSKPLYAANEDVRQIASQFIQQYFVVYDGESRQHLLNAYHENACFSLTVASGMGHNSKLAHYLPENRNLYRACDRERRRKLLKVGRLPVIATISELPKTKHDFNSFTMDVTVATNTMMVVTVTGIFREVTKDNNEAMRYFNRMFIILPHGTGYCISNEQLYISHPTDKQLKRFNTQSAPVTQEYSEPATSIPPVMPAPVMPPVVAVQPSDEIKQQMAIKLGEQTNMNLEWSLKCLVDVNWNYDVAMAAFLELFSAGRIPQEAFNK